MDDILTVRNADDAPVQNVEIPAEGINIPTDTGNGLFPDGVDPIAQSSNPQEMTEGLPVGQSAPQGQTFPQEENVAAPEQVGSKEDPSRMEYWQSQADKVKHDNFKLQDELDYYKNTLDPIANAIQSNPEILNQLENTVISSPPQQGSPTQGNLQGGLRQPTPPEKPHSYNEVDAYNDPESESFKFRLSKDQYRDDMLGYYGQVDAHRQREQENAMRQQQDNNAMHQAHSYAINNYGWDPGKASEFIQWAQNPSNVTLDNLARMYEISRSPSKQQVTNQQKVAEMQQQKQRMNVPRPAAVETGTPRPTMTEEQSFSASLLANKRR
jgi:hypothetical protein